MVINLFIVEVTFFIRNIFSLNFLFYVFVSLSCSVVLFNVMENCGERSIP